uniref:Metalloendopeptidase n=1 Tax=Caenorhabditis japonica TaxID=281687 RepID=A0A8R1DLY2_CAEJA
MKKNVFVFIQVLSHFSVTVLAAKQSWEINELLKTDGSKGDLTVFGDMVLTPAQLLRYEHSKDTDLQIRGVSIKENSFNRWENNIVPYTISPKYNQNQKNILISSLRFFETVSCFKFIERTSQVDFLFIVPLNGCYSYVGKIGGRQTVSLAADCLADYIIWHEMMHALGFEHEHQRPDRDVFIRVDYSNVIPGQLINFDKLQASLVDYPDTYDYKSIMHYDGHAFGRIDNTRRVRLATMIPLKTGIRLDDNMKFTSTDIEKLNRLGMCASQNQYSAQVTDCKDIANNCEGNKRRGMCKNPFYKNMMVKNCQKTCKLCAYPRMVDGDEDLVATSTVKVEKCEDSHPRCSVYAKSGFCTLPFYDNVREQLCAKTCNLC